MHRGLRRHWPVRLRNQRQCTTICLLRTKHLIGPNADLRNKLEQCCSVFQEVDDAEQSDRRQETRDAIDDYENSLDSYTPRFPEIIDWYYANQVGGAYLELRYESPDYYAEQIREHPERQLGFYRSAFSGRLGSDCYASLDSWLVPNTAELDAFFATTDQKYRIGEFIAGDILTLGGESFVLAAGLVAFFPMNQYFKSRVCASFAQRGNEDVWPPDLFAWVNATFTHSPEGEHLRMAIPESWRALEPMREVCLIHTSGTLIILNDGDFFHVLYDTKPLNLVATKNLLERVSETARGLSIAIGLSEVVTCDWATLSDEQFEQLCYDIIFAHPKFDSETIRKLGKSRSRDGGRDITVYEVARSIAGKPKKWVFQCKLITNGSSLTGTRLTDVGDMLDQFGAEGFGVMTSALIDATLYDKLDGVCRKRNIEQLHFSSLELERALTRNEVLRRRYFRSDQGTGP
jgi:hypothetical protein